MGNKKAVFNITLPFSTVRVADEDIDDIMESVMTGCAYWCGKAEPAEPYLGEYASEQISRGGKLKFHPVDDEPAELDKEKFREGLYKWLLSLKDESRVVHGGWIDPGQIDSIDGDSILQYALFGSIIYG